MYNQQWGLTDFDFLPSTAAHRTPSIKRFSFQPQRIGPQKFLIVYVHHSESKPKISANSNISSIQNSNAAIVLPKVFEQTNAHMYLHIHIHTHTYMKREIGRRTQKKKNTSSSKHFPVEEVLRMQSQLMNMWAIWSYLFCFQYSDMGTPLSSKVPSPVHWCIGAWWMEPHCYRKHTPLASGSGDADDDTRVKLF